MRPVFHAYADWREVESRVRGSARCWNTLEGLRAKADVYWLLRLPRTYGSTDIALALALGAADTNGMSSLPAYHLASVCRMPQADLKGRLALLLRNKDLGSKASVSISGKTVIFSGLSPRIFRRPDFWSSIPVRWAAELEQTHGRTESARRLKAAVFASHVATRRRGVYLDNASAQRWFGVGPEVVAELLEWAVSEMQTQGLLLHTFCGMERHESGAVFYSLDTRWSDEEAGSLEAQVGTHRPGFMGSLARTMLVRDGSLDGQRLHIPARQAFRIYSGVSEVYGILADLAEYRRLWLVRLYALEHGMPTDLPLDDDEFRSLIAERGAVGALEAYCHRLGADSNPDRQGLRHLRYKVGYDAYRLAEEARYSRYVAMTGHRAAEAATYVANDRGETLTAAALRLRIAKLAWALRDAKHSNQDILATLGKEKARWAIQACAPGKTPDCIANGFRGDLSPIVAVLPEIRAEGGLAGQIAVQMRAWAAGQTGAVREWAVAVATLAGTVVHEVAAAVDAMTEDQDGAEILDTAVAAMLPDAEMLRDYEYFRARLPADRPEARLTWQAAVAEALGQAIERAFAGEDAVAQAA